MRKRVSIHVKQFQISQPADETNSATSSLNAGVEIKQERMDMSPDGSVSGGGNGHHDTGDMAAAGLSAKLEPSDMKPPPEKKTKLM